MTKKPQTLDEAKARRNTILGGLGALRPEPLIREKPGPESLGDVMRNRKAARRAAYGKIYEDWG
jgi:hypothetical protein